MVLGVGSEVGYGGVGHHLHLDAGQVYAAALGELKRPAHGVGKTPLSPDYGHEKKDADLFKLTLGRPSPRYVRAYERIRYLLRHLLTKLLPVDVDDYPESVVRPLDNHLAEGHLVLALLKFDLVYRQRGF